LGVFDPLVTQCITIGDAGSICFTRFRQWWGANPPGLLKTLGYPNAYLGKEPAKGEANRENTQRVIMKL
jgi:hypothetical protein